MKHLACLAMLAAAVCCGCINAEKTDKTDKTKPKRTLGGMISAGSIEDVANVGRKRPPTGNGGVIPPQPAPFTDTRVSGKKGIIGLLTDEVVNYDVAMRKFPELQIVDNRNTATGYFGILAGAYHSQTSKISRLAFEKDMKLRAELNGGRFPTYNVYIQAQKSCRIKLAKLRPYQVYAYQEKTGKLVILEDVKLKQELSGN